MKNQLPLIFQEIMAKLLLSLALLSVVTALPQRQKHYLRWSYEEIDSEEHGQFKGPKGTNCTCGTSNKVAGRIVGGRETNVHEYPYMAGLLKSKGYGYGQFCGGAIITNHHILTAAHCTADLKRGERLAIVVGAHDLNDASRFTKMYDVADSLEHELYNPDTYENDIALLTTIQKISFNEAVGPVCLPTKPMNSKLVGEYVKVTGWGDTEFEGESSSVLLKVNLRVVPLDECSSQYRQHQMSVTNPTQFCTYTPEKDSCQGDSGGPVTWLDPETNRYTLVGVVSFGKDCATQTPGVNTDVFVFLPWIQRNIAKTAAETSTKRVNTCAKIG